MDFLLDGARSLGIFSQTTVASTKGTASVGGSASAQTDADAVKQLIEDTKNQSPSAERAGRFQTLSNIKSALDTASDALSEIAELNARRVDLAAQAAELPTGSKTEELAEESDSIEERINSIISTATYNGQQILSSSTTYSATVSSASLYDAVGVPNFSAVFSALSSSSSLNTFSSQESALANYDYLTTRDESINGLKGSFDAALGKASGLLETTLVAASKSPDAVPDIGSAEELAQKIATTIGSQYSTEESAQSLIDATLGNPDTKKISGLLSSD